MRNKNLILIIASMGVFVEALDIAIVNLAIPLIEQSFHLSTDKSYRLQSVYVLIYGGFLILGGKLSDVYGRRRIFLAGSFIFLITSLGAGLSSSFSFLVVFRALQGLGAALLMPSAFSICHFYFPEPGERGRAIGIFSSFAAIGSGSGLALGGIIASYLGWSWVFLINVPVLIFVLIAAAVCLEKDKPVQSKSPDIPSAIALILAMFALTLTAESFTQLSAQPEKFALYLLSGIISTIYLYRRLKRQPNPLIDISLFSIRSLRVGNTLFMLLGAFFTGYLFLISFIMQQNFGLPAAQAGLLLVPFSILSALVGRFMLPPLLSKWSDRIIALLGTACMVLGAVSLMLALWLHNLTMLLIGGALIAGIGMTLCFTGFSVIAMTEVPEQNLGLGSSLTTTAYFTGGGIGLPLISFFMTATDSPQQAGIAPLLLLALVAVVGLLVLGNFLVRERKETYRLSANA